MPLNFTDDQIKELTGRVLATPEIIAGLEEEKGRAVARKDDYKFLDDANEVYTNYFNNIQVQYHEELKYLNGQLRTNYNLANIQSAGKLEPGNVHFPFSPVWANFPPKKIDSNEGGPIGSWTDTEPAAIALIQSWLDYLLTGFNDGAVSDTTETIFTGSTVEVTNGGFSPGQRVIFISGSNFLLGTVTAVAAMPVTTGMQLITVSIILSNAGYSGIGIGATVDTFHPGFNNTQRETTSDPFMDGLKNQIDAAVNVWESRINAQKTALQSNDPQAPEEAEIAAALTDVNTAIDTIIEWEGYPYTGSGTARFGDTNLPVLTNNMSTRGTQASSRSAQIISRLGSINQDGSSGSFTGSGQYLYFFQNLDLRVNRAAGTLRNYYQMDLIIQVFDQQIDQAQATADRDNVTFTIFKFADDGDGSNTVKLMDATGLTVSQAVKVMSNELAVFDAVVQSIDGNTVVLDVVVPNTYVTGDAARLVIVN